MMDTDAVIRSLSPGKTFADVGGLWGLVAEKVTVAAAAGASAVTMIDFPFSRYDPLWNDFKDRCKARGVVCDCLHDDVNSTRAGPFDVVHCAGVVYHSPNPFHMVTKLAAMTRGTLLLGSTRVPTSIAGLELPTGAALFVPAMTDEQKKSVHAFFGVGMIGITTDNEWRAKDYGPWWWVFTEACLVRMVEAAGMHVEAVWPYWEGRAVMIRAVHRMKRKPLLL